MKEVCVGFFMWEVTNPPTPVFFPCKFMSKCKKFVGGEPTGFNKPKDMRKCKDYRKFEKENENV